MIRHIMIRSVATMRIQINTDSNGSSDGDSELFLSKTLRKKVSRLQGLA